MAFDYSINQCRDVWLSIYGTPAFKTVTGKFISFDKEKQKYIDVTEEVIRNTNYLFYDAPYFKKELKKGDFIRHNGLWNRILDIKDDVIYVESICVRERAEIVTMDTDDKDEVFLKLVCMVDEEEFTGPNKDKVIRQIIQRVYNL